MAGKTLARVLSRLSSKPHPWRDLSLAKACASKGEVRILCMAPIAERFRTCGEPPG